jgi:hypothetical protein
MLEKLKKLFLKQTSKSIFFATWRIQTSLSSQVLMMKLW